MTTTDLNATQNTQEDEDTAAEKQFNRKICRAFLFLLYACDALLIGANIQIWTDLFSTFFG